MGSNKFMPGFSIVVVAAGAALMTWTSLHMAKQGSSVLVVILFAVGALDLVLGTIIEVRHASGFASHEPTIWTWIFVGLAAALIACSLLFGQHIQTLSSVVAACVFLSVLVTRGNACSESAQPMTTPNKSSEQHSTDTPITCDLRPSVIAWPFHSVFTRPYVRIDEDVAHTSWGRSTITLPTSRFQQPNSGIPNATVSVGFSYRWLLHQRLGEARVAIPQPAFTYIRARLGPFNSSPFRIHEVRS